ncbi:MAG: VOC family protein [Planctomycetes bacterium]|nr:VOC family protein [Planctomycetota bacterium]
MSNHNRDHNRAVWFDIPVADLDRSVDFYSAVLDCEVSVECTDELSFGVIAHDEGNGGCLVPRSNEVSRDGGILLYLNVHGRIRDAVAKCAEHGGELVNDVHSIGPHGFRAICRDSEGNRIALHSEVDA